MKFAPGSRARKVGGSYQATGTIRASFRARDGSPRYVFDFDQPPGLLHIFGEAQLAADQEPPIEAHTHPPNVGVERTHRPR